MSACTESRSTIEPLCAITALRGVHNMHNRSLYSVADWVTEINQFLPRDRTSTFELARLLHTVKAALPYGHWSALWREKRIHFGKRKAEYLVFVWEKLGDLTLDAQTFAQLPAGWLTLYYLAHLDRPTLEQLIGEHAVHAGLTWLAARELARKFKGIGRKGSKLNVKQHLQRLRKFLLTALPDGTPEQWEFAETELLDLAHQIALRKPQRKRSQESDLRRIPPSKTLSASSDLNGGEPIHFPSPALFFVEQPMDNL